MSHDYDVGAAFKEIEEILIDSMIRNLKRHRDWEKEEGFDWSMWQVEQIKALEKFRLENKSRFKKIFAGINSKVRRAIEKAFRIGGQEEEVEILKAIRRGFVAHEKPTDPGVNAAFFHLNKSKMDALLTATERDLEDAEIAILRKTNDEYRKVIFNAQVYFNSGAGTLDAAIDMATASFLARGINCIQYKNGRTVTISVYAEMALRTASLRAKLYGEAQKRDEWGINTVIVSKRGLACPKCVPFTGRVFTDDVWSSIPPGAQPKYPLLSGAIAQGLYHPNCKCGHTTFFEGVTTEPEPPTKKQQEDIIEKYDAEQHKKYCRRNYEKYARLEKNSLDPENKKKYSGLKQKWADEL